MGNPLLSDEDAAGKGGGGSHEVGDIKAAWSLSFQMAAPLSPQCLCCSLGLYTGIYGQGSDGVCAHWHSKCLLCTCAFQCAAFVGPILLSGNVRTMYLKKKREKKLDHESLATPFPAGRRA